MSDSSVKGVSLEKEVAKLLQKKLGARVARDKRSGAGTHQKMDITNYYGDIPLAIECKDHKTIKIKEWFRQAVSGASPREVPTVVFRADLDVLATLRMTDLVDIIAERDQLQRDLDLLRKPITLDDAVPIATAKKALSSSVSVCRNGHIINAGSSKCLMKGCPYGFGFKAKRVKN